MKKCLLLLVMIALGINLQAQQNTLPVNPGIQQPSRKALFDAAKFNSNKGPGALKSTVDEHWLCYGRSIDQLNAGGIGVQGPAVLSQNYLFPDSLCYGEFGAGNFAPIWLHHLGDVLDVKSLVFNLIDSLTWDATTSYSVDSMSIMYAYNRTQSVTDTLIVTLCTNNIAANMPGLYFTGLTAQNYLTDTLSFRGLKFLAATNALNAVGKITVKIPLTDDDTAITFFREKQFAIPSFIVPAGKLTGVDVQFKPGYSYALGDSIDYQHNAFFFTSFEEFGASTLPTFFDCDFLSANCDYNCSFIVPQEVRYNLSTNGWNGYYIPAYGYTVDFAYEHHLISYKVTSPPLGTGIQEANNHFILAQNTPNPFTNKTTIRYQLLKPANAVSIQVFDTKGVKLFEENTSHINPGNYSLDITNEHIAPGIYFCTLTVDGEKITNKIVAQ